MKNIKLGLLVVLLVFAATGYSYADGGNRNGTAGATELLIPVGTRGIAMGSATLTDAKGVEALFWNPAGLARGESNTNVMFSQMTYIADIGVSYGAVSTTIEGFGSLAMSVKSLAVGDILTTTTANPDGTGQTYSPEYMTIGLTYAKALSDRITVGLTANYISETLDKVGTHGFAFNVGIAYQNLGNINGLSFAVVMKNLGPQMKFDGTGLDVKAVSADLSRPQQYYKIDAAPFDLPATLELGVGYRYNVDADNMLTLQGAFNNANYYNDEYKGGLEYSYNNMFFVRGGYLYTADLKSEQNVYGLTAGAGFNYKMDDLDVKIDYAYRQAKYFNANHVFSVAIGF